MGKVNDALYVGQAKDKKAVQVTLKRRKSTSRIKATAERGAAPLAHQKVHLTLKKN